VKFNEARKIIEATKKFQQVLDEMVTVMGVEAQNHSVKAFRDQGFTDETLEKWKPRKRPERGRQRAILVKTGRLRRSIRKVKFGQYSVKVVSDVPYARRHSEGLDRMPKRQIMGYSGVMERKIMNRFHPIIRKAWEN